ncbi:hypothetical protein CVT25_010389 [Psilocybe cyanescens]|uniref:Uncharacterized protein n=1 Tax=Psilocybe cyanescens TaxID=93625 RepID=A0A409XPD3_PSICY|nr:hypothetical protein CVT25_010389 [Psilocybe cyanescens]
MSIGRHALDRRSNNCPVIRDSKWTGRLLENQLKDEAQKVADVCQEKSGRPPKIEERIGVLIALDNLVFGPGSDGKFLKGTSSLSKSNTTLCWALNDGIGHRQSPRRARPWPCSNYFMGLEYPDWRL